MAKTPTPNRLQFGPFLADFRACELRKDGRKIRLQEKPMLLLGALTASPGEVVSREELQKQLWPDDTFVDFETGLNAAVRKLREALADNPENPRYIETIPKHGYRFLGQVHSSRTDEPISRKQPSPKMELTSTSLGRRTIASLVETVAEYRRANRFWMSIAAALALGGLALTVVQRNVPKVASVHERLFGASGAPAIHSIAVLPLENLSGDPTQEYLSDGMTDALITDLAQMGSLRVISRTSSMQYKNTKKSMPEIARTLNVDAIIEGTVQRSGDRVRITAQLIEAPADRHLWAKTYEGDLRHILSLESEVAGSIAREIDIHLTRKQRERLASTTPINGEAYELYLKGRYFWNKRDREGLKKALDYFQRAAEKEPKYAPAQAGLADTYSVQAAAGYDLLPTAEAMDRARTAARRAIEIDDGLAEAHASLGFINFSYDWDWTAAEKEFTRAIALNPNYATVHQWYSEYLDDLGRFDEAFAEAKAALMLDPLSLILNENVARVHYFARRFDQAVEGSKKTLEMDSRFPISHLRLGRAYAAKGMLNEAIQEFQLFATLSGNTPLATASIANALARSGNRRGALRALNELIVLSNQKHVPAICFALVYIGLGDRDEAVTRLEEAYKERSDFLLVLSVDPLFDGLRSDPRFQDLLRRMKLPDVPYFAAATSILKPGTSAAGSL